MIIKITVGTTYCGCEEETIDFEYYGTPKEFENDHQASTEILNMLTCGEFGHYFLDFDYEDTEEDED